MLKFCFCFRLLKKYIAVLLFFCGYIEKKNGNAEFECCREVCLYILCLDVR